jgi:hypothetical protein
MTAAASIAARICFFMLLSVDRDQHNLARVKWFQKYRIGLVGDQ